MWFQYALEQSKGSSSSGRQTSVKSMGADEFLPIHMFVVVRAKLENPLLLRALLYTMCDENSLQVGIA